MANRKWETLPGRVWEETCGALLIEFENNSFISATGSYLKPKGMVNAEIRFLCTNGGIQMQAMTLSGISSIRVFRQGKSEVRSFKKEPSPFVRQADTFLNTIEGNDQNKVRNPPADALLDVHIAEVISMSAREQRMVSLKNCSTLLRIREIEGRRRQA